MEKIPFEKMPDIVAELCNKIDRFEALLTGLNQPAGIPVQDQPKKYLNYKETAAFFGRTMPTIYNWVKDGKIKAYRLNGRVMFDQAELEKCYHLIRTG